MTRKELIAQCKKDNPKMVATINDEQYELNDEEYNQAAEAWADMIIAQQNLDA
jgi:hypothetical protein